MSTTEASESDPAWPAPQCSRNRAEGASGVQNTRDDDTVCYRSRSRNIRKREMPVLPRKRSEYRTDRRLNTAYRCAIVAGQGPSHTMGMEMCAFERTPSAAT